VDGSSLDLGEIALVTGGFDIKETFETVGIALIKQGTSSTSDLGECRIARV
jgi:hypothetical protein